MNREQKKDIQILDDLRADIYRLFPKINKINVRTFPTIQIKCRLIECYGLIDKTINIIKHRSKNDTLTI